jgi:hypothetical protein
VTFPLAEFEYEEEQGLYVPAAALTGGHYDLDQLGTASPVKQSAMLRISARVVEDTPDEVDAAVQNILARCWSIGRGKLWTRGRVSAAEVLRWAWARPLAMPRVEWAAGGIVTKDLRLAFRRMSDWYGDTLAAYTGASAVAITTDPQVVTITNAGDAKVFNAIITLSGTYTNPVIANAANSYQLESTRTGASANDQLRFDAGARRVERSTDGGSTWAGDYGAFVRPAGQIQLFVLEPGDNDLTITGVTTGTLDVSFYPAFH